MTPKFLGKTIWYRLAQLSAGLVGAGLLLFLILLGFSWLFKPDTLTQPSPPDPVRQAEVEEARQRRLSKNDQPRIQVDVDYSEGKAATWWPRGESPILSELAEEGSIPPVNERVGPEPVVMRGVEGVGAYGGAWRRLAGSDGDVSTVGWRLSYTTLVRWSPEGPPIVPHLAREWTISDDFREFTFYLRKGLRWSDGEPFTADDIQFWYEWEVKYFDLLPSLLRGVKGMGRVEKVDEHTIKFIFDEPNVLFLERLASSATAPGYTFGEYCLPKHYLSRVHPEIGDQELIARLMKELKLSSSRALYMRLKDWKNPDHPRLWPWVLSHDTNSAPYVFVRNPFYYAVDPQGNQLPYLDRLVVEVRPSTMFGLTAATGQVTMQDRFIRYEDHVLLMSSAEQNGYDVYHWYNGSRSPFAIFPVINRRVDPERPETLWKHQLLNDRRFRQALSYAINREDIISALFNGQTEPAQLDPGRDSPFFSEKLYKSFTEHNPARANELLDEVGLTRRDSEGYRTFPDGSRMTWYLNFTDYTNNDPAQFVIDDWAEVGIRCVQRLRSRLLFNAEKAAREHDFTVWMGESEFMPLVEARNFVPTYTESFYAPGFGMWFLNGGLVGNSLAERAGAVEPPLDHPLRRNMEILSEIYVTVDPEKRRELFRQIQESNAEELWIINICSPPPQLVVVKNGFRNVPRMSAFSTVVQSPGNAGIETYYWENPDEPLAIRNNTKASVARIAKPAGFDSVHLVAMSGGSTVGVNSASRIIGGVVQWLLIAGGVLGLVLLVRRHPFIGRRIALMVPTLLIVSVLVFGIVQAPPGDFVTMKILEYQMEGSSIAEQSAKDLRSDFHLDEPMITRYLRWIGLYWFTTFSDEDAGLLQGNLGLSMEQNRSVEEVVGDRILLTIAVSVLTVMFTWLVALPLGIYSAVRQYSVTDYILTLLCFVGASVPGFLLAVVLMYLANSWLDMPISGLFSPEFATMPGWNTAKVLDLLAHIWLPVFVLGVGGAAMMVRVMRANLLDELRKPYVTTARAKGVRPLKLLLKYPVRMALNPFVSGLGAIFPQLVSGGAIVALVLSLPMVGPVMLEALLAEDVYLAGSMLMILSLLGVVGTLVSDLLLLWLDPRIRFEGGGR